MTSSPDCETLSADPCAAAAAEEGRDGSCDVADEVLRLIVAWIAPGGGTLVEGAGRLAVEIADLRSHVA